jgi:glycosyltransferase involved in cell wall biosynthesis
MCGPTTWIAHRRCRGLTEGNSPRGCDALPAQDFWVGLAADTSACGWYRIELPLAEYNRRGGDAEWSTEMPLWVPTDADVVIGQRVALPEASTVWQQLCRLGRSRMVLELDDDLWNIPPSNIKAHKAFTPGLLENLRRNIEMSDAVTVTTDVLAEVVAEHNPNVHVVPNRIPAWLLEHQRPQRDEFTVGWAGGPSHEIDWVDAAPQVGRFLKRNPAVGVHLMGASFRSMLSWERQRIRLDRWIDSLPDYYRALDFDVALAPLAAHVFNRGKSGLRLLEMAALGIPVVASDFGPYADPTLHGVRGFLVKADHEWPTHLRALASNPDLRADMSRAGREWAAERTVEGNLGDWLNAWQVDVKEPVTA